MNNNDREENTASLFVVLGAIAIVGYGLYRLFGSNKVVDDNQKAANDNRSNQMNPNNWRYQKARNH